MAGPRRPSSPLDRVFTPLSAEHRRAKSAGHVARAWEKRPAIVNGLARLGSEFAEYEQLESTLDREVFFTDPRAPWQKETNENTNGLTLQFFSKGTDFNQVSRYKVARAENLLNDRPRKRLHYQTPNEVFAQQRSRAFPT